MEESLLETIRALAQSRDVALSRGDVGEVDEETDWVIHSCSASVFHSLGLYHIERWVKWMCETWYLGWAPGYEPYWLEGDPAAFLSMARVDGVRLERIASVWEYAQWYLLITQSRHWSDFILIESVDQVCFLDKVDVDMSPLDRLRKDTFLSHYTSQIRQPHIHRVHQTANVEVFAIRNQNLEQHHLLIDRNGNLHHTCTILEADLPLAVAGSGSGSLITGFTSRES